MSVEIEITSSPFRIRIQLRLLLTASFCNLFTEGYHNTSSFILFPQLGSTPDPTSGI